MAPTDAHSCHKPGPRIVLNKCENCTTVQHNAGEENLYCLVIAVATD